MRVVWKDPECWMLFEDGERLVLDVLVSKSAVDYAISIELDSEQAQAYRDVGIEYARELAENVQQSSGRFSHQYVAGFASDPEAREAVARWRREHDRSAAEVAGKAWDAIESYARQALLLGDDDPRDANSQLFIVENLQRRLALKDPAPPDDVASRLGAIVAALIDSVLARGVADRDAELRQRVADARRRAGVDV